MALPEGAFDAFRPPADESQMVLGDPKEARFAKTKMPEDDHQRFENLS